LKDEKMTSRLDREKVKQTIALILDKIRTDADPVLLNEYRRLFQREISLFRRSWAAAYLLMLFDQGGGLDRNRPPDRQGEIPRRNLRSEARDAGRRYSLAEEESRQLFISIGRNRRVFPREILGLINSKTAVPREDIGVIRILDNYSFVQVRDTAAGEIIAALNGQLFRGKPITVNYAKSKKDENDGTDENRSENPEADSEQYEDQPDKEDI
jgi:hypothetical protein